MKLTTPLFILLLFCSSAFSQIHTDQNGLKTSVTNVLNAPGADAVRYHFLSIGYNSFHWQPGGTVIVELFRQNFSTGYKKYFIEVGFGQGANSGTPVLKLVQSEGMDYGVQLTFGQPTDLSTSLGGQVNKVLPIFLDIMEYGAYRAKVTYLQDRVEQITAYSQVQVNVSPPGTPISGFSAARIPDQPLATTGSLQISGSGNHYIQNGNLGIGTTTPAEKLSVNGNIRAKEIKVEAANWPDYVFDKGYANMPLDSLEQFIKKHKHLPQVPAAAEAEAKGVSLGEMNKLLLQKIEELTLHVIDLQKQVTELKKIP